MRIDKKLLFIFLLALFLRVIFLGSVPAGFHNDEVDVGYAGKFILLHGRDPTGNILPLAFNKYGDFRPTGLFYLAGISQLIFGVNEFAVRFPTALFGALTVFPLFFLARELFRYSKFKDSRSARHLKKPFDQSMDEIRSDSVDLTYASARQHLKRKSNFWSGLASSYFLRWFSSLSKKRQLATSNQLLATIAYFAAFFLAILPWHIVLSRAGHEAIVGYFLITWGLVFLVRFMQTGHYSSSEVRSLKTVSSRFTRTIKSQRLLVYSFLFLVSSYLFYHGTRTLVPLLLIVFLLVWRNRVLVRLSIFFVVLTGILILLPVGRGRLSQVVFYKDPNLVNKLEVLPYADKGDILAARIFHNKLVVYSRALVANHLQYFSPDFLFLRGGYPERYLVPEVGLLPILMVWPLVWGFIFIYKKGGVLPVLVLWLLVSPVGAVLTYDDIPSVTRSSFMIIPLVLIAGCGFWKIFRLKNKIIILFFLMAIVLEMLFFGHQYYIHQKSHRGFLRDEGNKEIAEYLFAQKGNYELVIAPYGPNLPFYYLFFNSLFDDEIEIDLSDRSANFQYKNILFVRHDCPTQLNDYRGLNALYIDQGVCEESKVGGDKRLVFEVKQNGLTVAFRAYVREGK